MTTGRFSIFLTRRAAAPALLASLLASAALIAPLHAQTAPQQPLPSVEIAPPKEPAKPTREKKKRRQQSESKRVVRAPAQQPVAIPVPSAPANSEASRVAELGGIPGAPTTVITADQIARAPQQTVQDILANEPGIQTQNLFGSVNGVQSTVDVRGFGATASSNTLILLNGRRLNDADLQGVDLSTIPLQSIQRIEITRGSSGAVLYGDNAVGGVINIVTKTGVDSGKPAQATIEGAVGSYGYREGRVSVSANAGPWSTAAFGNAVESNGYRQNNHLLQHNANGEIRYSTPDFGAFLNVTGDDQRVGLAGGRTISVVGPTNQYLSSPQGTNSPFDFAGKQGASLTAGITKTLWNGGELIIDGGVRTKEQQGAFFGNIPLSTFNGSYVGSQLQTWSITPRLTISNPFFGLNSKVLTGIDYYDAHYDSRRSRFFTDPPADVYTIDQTSLAGYWQQTIGLFTNTDLSYGGRLQRNGINATDQLNVAAPNYFFGQQQAAPLDSSETNYAWDVGLEHRLNNVFSIFGRSARAFRVPNVDERIGSSPFGSVGNFALKTQTSVDAEGGLRIHSNSFDLQTSYFDIRLKNELHLDPITFVNTNFDPTHRFGSETLVSLGVTDTLRLKGGLTYTRAVFSEGPFAGNDVPLVSRITGSAGLSWDIWQKYLVLDITARGWSSRHLDSDEANQQPVIPANATVDLKISGTIDRLFWSVAVTDLLDTRYYDYGVYSSFSQAYSVYPLPGRTVLVRAGMTF